jgi:hypothetical protein
MIDRAPYHSLSKNARKVVDTVRRLVAEELAKQNNIPFDEALSGIIELHDAGYLTLVEREDDDGTKRIGLVPCCPDGGPLLN